MSVLPVLLDTWSRVSSLWAFVGTRVLPDELSASIINTNPFTIFKCRRPNYLSRELEEIIRYACLYNNYLYLYNSSPPKILHSMMFSNFILLEIDRDINKYTITIQISHDPIDEGELSLLFMADGSPIYTVSFTIIPGYAVGLSDRHAILISRMQGVRAKFNEIRRATKDMSDISPQAILVAALEGIGIAAGIRHIAGIRAADQASYNDNNSEILTRIYEGFYDTIGNSNINDNFCIIPVPFPKKPLKLVKPGHRLRTKLKQKIKAEIGQSVCALWQNIVSANGDYAAPTPSENAQAAAAEAWYRAGAPADELRLHFSANPFDGRDWFREEALAENLRTRFPDVAAGYQIGASALREMRRFDEASAVVAEARERFPNEPWPLAEAAWIARTCRDVGETIRLSAELRSRFADNPAGYQIGAIALREMRQFDEAALVAAAGMNHFPAEAWPIAEAAWTARALNDGETAIRLAAELRRRAPDNPAGYQIGASGLREAHRLDEAASVAAEAVARFPAEAWPLSAAAWVARACGETDRAICLAVELRFRFPDEPAGYQIGAAELREQHRLDEAASVAAEGMTRFPTEAWPVKEAAWIARILGRDDEAIRLAAELHSRFPDDSAGYQIAQSVPTLVEFEY